MLQQMPGNRGLARAGRGGNDDDFMGCGSHKDCKENKKSGFNYIWCT
jgi:hypothetical protein